MFRFNSLLHGQASSVWRFRTCQYQTEDRIRNGVAGKGDRVPVDLCCKKCSKQGRGSKKILPEFRRYYVRQVKLLVGKEYAQETLKRFKAAFSSLEAYLQHKKIDDIKLRELNHQFITRYEFFFKNRSEC